MKEKTLYTCEICNTDFANKSDAQKCEEEHEKYTGIIDHIIYAHRKYPNRIKVEFSDGTTQWYRQ